MSALPQAVLFDLDGTLVDSLPTLERLTNELLMEFGRRPVASEDVRRFVGDGPAKLLERALAASGGVPDDATFEALAQAFLARYEREPVEGTLVFPGMRESLALLSSAGVQLGVVTNKPAAVSKLILDRLDLAVYFGVVVGGDTLREKKPSPLPVLHALEVLGCSAQASWFVGDSSHDYQAARSGGCAKVILMQYGYGHTPVHTLAADAHLDDLYPYLQKQ